MSENTETVNPLQEVLTEEQVAEAKEKADVLMKLHQEHTKSVAKVREIEARSFHLLGAYINGMTSKHGSYEFNVDENLRVLSDIRDVVGAITRMGDEEMETLENLWADRIRETGGEQ